MQQKKGFLGKVMDWISVEEDYVDEDSQEQYEDEPVFQKQTFDDYHERGRSSTFGYSKNDNRVKEEIPNIQEPYVKKKSFFSSSQNNVVNMPPKAEMTMIVFQPSSIRESSIIIDNLKERKPVIVNLELLEPEWAQRVLDYVHGAIDALNGSIQKVSKGIFVLAPRNVDIEGNVDEGQERRGANRFRRD